MLSHYVKVSFRELLKYRTQSIVSIIGLAVGFTAFILGGYWLWSVAMYLGMVFRWSWKP